MSFDVVDEPPVLDNQYETDRVLQSYMQRHLPASIQKTVEPELMDLGRLAGGPLHELQRTTRGNEPTMGEPTPWWQLWGEADDAIETTALWDRAETLAAERGVVATAYEQEHGRFSRVHQMALAYLFMPSTGLYGTTLAATDGAARTLMATGGGALAEEAVSHLTSRDPQSAWTAGEWVTEHRDGTERSLPTARRDASGAWRLHGRKMAVHDATTNLALALARREEDGARALFYVPLRGGEDLQGERREGLVVDRLRNTVGARHRPTADLTLDGALAYPVTEGLSEDEQALAPMRTVTRAWDAVTATALMRRSLALTRDYAQKRTAFGDDLINHPLHQETLADAQATLDGAFHLSFRVAELMGACEAGEADDGTHALLRLLAPIAKLTTAKQAVATTSEMLEAFRDTGYTDHTGVPSLLRNAQALPLRGGTTNEQALALIRTFRDIQSFAPIKKEVERCIDAIDAPTLIEAARPAAEGIRDAARWLKDALDEGEEALQAGARRFAVTLGKSLEVLYTARHAQWSLQEEQDGRSAAAAERLAARQTNQIADLDPHDAYVLVWDFNCPTLFDCHAAGDDTSENEPVLDGGFADVM